MGKLVDLTGRRFGRWVVLSHSGTNKHGRHLWRCRCDCGSVKDAVIGENLLSGGSLSCGCLQREKSASAQRKHGHLNGGRCSLTYNTWRGMVGRCTNPSDKSYPFYGGRGISLCDRWLEFGAFLSDVGERPGRSYEIDRIDNSKGYEPGNVRWVTHKQNGRNTRTNRTIDTPEGPMLLCEASERSGLHVSILLGRISRGWPAADLFKAPRKLDKQQVRMVQTPNGEMRLADACRHFGVSAATVSTRMASGWSEDRLFEAPRTRKRSTE